MFSDLVFASQKLEEAKHAAASIENEKENSSVAILQSNESFSDNAIYKWSHEVILFLIEEYRIRKNDFNSSKISQKKFGMQLAKNSVRKATLLVVHSVCPSLRV